MADNRETLWFKQVPEGYVFRAPTPWIFGRARYFLVNAAQKAQLLTALTARSQFATLTIVLLAFLAMFGASISAIVYATRDGDYPVGTFVVTMVLVLLSLYAALLIATLPLAGRVEPLLAGLPPTDQRITAADRRAAAQKAIWLPSHLTLAASQMILSAMCFVEAIHATGGNPASLLHNFPKFSFAFAGCCFVFASIILLISAFRKFREGQQETVPADQRLRKMLLPGFSLLVSTGVLIAVIYANQLQAKAEAATAQRLERLTALEDRAIKSDAARRALDARIISNTARKKALIDMLSHPAVKCDAAIPADDRARQQNTGDCAERARKEKSFVEGEMDKAKQEAAALQQEEAGILKEYKDISGEIATLRAELYANR